MAEITPVDRLTTQHEELKSYFDAKRNMLLSLLKYKLGSVLLTGEEEDALQEIMLKCFVSIRDRKKIDDLEAFVTTVLNNHCISLLRSKTRMRRDFRKTYSLEELMETTYEDGIVDIAPNPEKALLSKEKLEIIESAIGKLNSRKLTTDLARNIAKMHYLEGISQKEITAILAEGEIATIQAQEKADQLTSSQAKSEIKKILEKKSGIVRSSLDRSKKFLQRTIDASLAQYDSDPEVEKNEDATTEPNEVENLASRTTAEQIKKDEDPASTPKKEPSAKRLKKKTSYAFTGTSETKEAA